MRGVLATIAVVAQIAVLVVMIGEREYIARYGHIVHLRTAPIDPRDVFRGDFVRLDYEISVINHRGMRDSLDAHLDERDFPFYAVIRQGPGGLAELDHATDVRPAAMPYIRGRLNARRRAGIGPDAAWVRYGIEQLYVQQGAGLAIEERRGERTGLQVPLEVEVALGPGGTAVITGHRWSRLGVQLEFLRMPERPPNANLDELEGPLSPLVRVTLVNVSDAPLAVVNPGDNCGFSLVAVSWAGLEYTPVGGNCAAVVASESDVRTLAPDEGYGVEIDLSDPRWHVGAGGGLGEIGRLAEFDRFRLVYRAPDEATLGTLAAADEVWRGYLPTAAFNAFGRVD